MNRRESYFAGIDRRRRERVRMARTFPFRTNGI
jgi:hypothetical protein